MRYPGCMGRGRDECVPFDVSARVERALKDAWSLA